VANKKISALTGATTPLAGTEVLPVVQSSATTKVTIDNLTAGRAVSAASYSATGNGYFYGATPLAGTAEIGLGTNSVSNAYLNLQSSGNSQVRLYTGATYRGGIYSVGTGVVISNNGNAGQNVNVSVDGGGTNAWVFDTSSNLSPTVAAKGINFTANTGAAGKTSQLLNWYEEGTFTATLTSVTPPTTPITATAYYTRIGNLVTVLIAFRNVDNTGAAGQIKVSGLPFTSNASSFAIGQFHTDRAGTGTMVSQLGPSNTTVVIIDSSGVSVSWTSAGPGVYCGCQITYKV